MKNNKDKKFRRGTINLLFKAFNYVKYKLILGIVISLTGTLLSLASPLFLQRLVDKEIDIHQGIINEKSFFIVSGLYLLSILLGSFVRFLAKLQLKISSNDAGRYLRRDIYEKAMKLPLSFYDKTPVGKITSRIVSDIEGIKNFFFIGFSGIFSSISFILFSIIYVITIDLKIAVILILPVPILIFLVYLYNKFSAKYNIQYRKENSKITADMTEHLNGAGIIRAFGVSNKVNDDFENLNKKLFNTGKKVEYVDAFLSFNISGTLSNLSSILILLISGYSFIKGDGKISIGFMLVLLNYSGKIYDNINEILRRINIVEKALASSHHIVEFLDENNEIDNQAKFEKISGNVEFKDVSFSYIKNNPVLHGINFKASAGSRTAIVGDTGSGKSSIISLLFGFYEPDEGSINIDGNNIRLYNKESYRKQMALVLQEPFIFDDTLRNNITLGANFSDELIISSLKLSGGENLLNKLHYNLDTKLNGEGVGLSLGEKQIVTFARTIIRNPKILVLDEATASIDTETEKLIDKGLKNLMEGRTTFIIAHRLSTIRSCDNIIVLEKGKIVETGTHNELMNKKGKYFTETVK